MEILAVYKIGITVLIPVFSALTCGVLIVLSLRDCLMQEEYRLKKILLIYLSLSALGWYMTFCYEFHPVLFTWLNVLCLLSFVLPSLFFFRIVRYLTRLGKRERFSPLHYLLPAILAVVLLIWSLFVPLNVQVEIVKGKALVFPAGYELYARFFTLKPFLRVVFGIAYYILTIVVLVQYSKNTRGKQTSLRKSVGWVIFLVGISVASLLSSLLPTFMPRVKILHSLWTLAASCAIAFQHILLSYHIIRRKYRLYITQEDVLKKAILGEINAVADTSVSSGLIKQTVPASRSQRRYYNGKLTRDRFEACFRNKKPWLNPACKIADLVELLDVNRTVLSAFINKTYGMNFNRYLNRWRIEELDRLRSLTSNQDKSARSLIGKAGFDNYRTYLRAVAAEREAAKQKRPDKKKGGTE